MGNKTVITPRQKDTEPADELETKLRKYIRDRYPNNGTAEEYNNHYRILGAELVNLYELTSRLSGHISSATGIVVANDIAAWISRGDEFRVPTDVPYGAIRAIAEIASEDYNARHYYYQYTKGRAICGPTEDTSSASSTPR